MPKLVWRVKLVAELGPGMTAETELARIERGEEEGLAGLGLRLEEVKRLTATLQAEIVTAQVTAAGERGHWCAACGSLLASRASPPATRRGRTAAAPCRPPAGAPVPARSAAAAPRASPPGG